MIFIMNCKPESSISLNSNWQLSSLFLHNIYTQMFLLISTLMWLCFQTVLSNDEQNIRKIKLNCKAEGIVKAFSTNTNVA